TWLALGVGFFIVCFLDLAGALGPAEFRPPWWEWIMLALLGLAVAGVVHWMTAPKEPAPPPPPAPLVPGIGPGWAVVEPWLRAESPAEDDLLNRRLIAKRCARRLLTPFGKGDVTIGLVGGFGSGKSSIIRWLREELNAARVPGAPEVWICEVSC